MITRSGATAGLPTRAHGWASQPWHPTFARRCRGVLRRSPVYLLGPPTHRLFVERALIVSQEPDAVGPACRAGPEVAQDSDAWRVCPGFEIPSGRRDLPRLPRV